MKYYSILCNFFFISFICLTAYRPTVAQDLALNKNYTLSTLPNYAYSAPSSDKTSLTDGIFTNGKYFWHEKTTIGWESFQQVTITIDLEKIEPIGKVTFNTVRSINSGIYFPKNIFVFISNDNQNFKYLGDAADVTNNLPGNLLVQKFFLGDINESARYVTLFVVPQGSLIFCDEIEVLKGNDINKPGGNTIANNVLNQFVDSLRTPKISRRILEKKADKIGNALMETDAKGKKDISEIVSELNTTSSLHSLAEIEDRIGKVQASALRKKFNLPFVVEKYNTWDSLSEFHEPNYNTNTLNYQFIIPVGQVQYSSFIISNLDTSDEKFYFKLSNNNPVVNEIELYSVPYVPQSYFKKVPDPMVPVTNFVTITPGKTMMFIVKLTAIKTGDSNSHITISSGGQSSTLNLNVKAVDLFIQTKRNYLNVNVWANFNNPIIIGREKEVAADLKMHHVNTFVIPPTEMPNLNTKDYEVFANYLKNFPNAKNILLFMDYSSIVRRNGYQNGKFMSDEWKKYFIEWYRNVKRLAINSQFSDSDVYLYPYDEIQEKDIDDFLKLISWAKKAIPGVKFYATLGNEKAIDSILPVIDIAQIYLYKGIKQFPAHSAQIWTYDNGGMPPSRGLSPYGFYRLMAWNAFFNDYSGIGFWNYADERNGNNESELNLISGLHYNNMCSYSVVYDGPGKEIISSRRWEAFQLGIEDYSIIQYYSQRFGKESAKALVRDVIDEPDNINLADSIRNRMIMALSLK